MKHSVLDGTRILALAAAVLLSACQTTDDGFVLSDESEHKFNLLTAVEDSEPLSRLVRNALKGNSQTVVSSIRVSQDSSDTVKLTGFVHNDSVRYEAERIASNVDGVRFVVNNLIVR